MSSQDYNDPAKQRTRKDGAMDSLESYEAMLRRSSEASKARAMKRQQEKKKQLDSAKKKAEKRTIRRKSTAEPRRKIEAKSAPAAKKPAAASAVAVKKSPAAKTGARPTTKKPAARPQTKKKSTAPKRGGKRRRKKGAKLVVAVAMRAVIFILIAAIISAVVLSIANDAFALTKTDETEVVVTIPEGATTKQIAGILKDNDLIKYEFAYVLYAKMTKEDGTAKYGEFVLSYDMTYDNMMTTMKRGPLSETNPDDVRVTIPEGYECSQIVDLLVEKGLGTKENFDDVINNQNFGYDFIDRIPAGRSYYRLEGYLFPDTYIFSKTEGEKSIIRRMLLNFDSKITVELYDRMNELGFTLDQAITLASIIEKEAGKASDMPLISSVFHNRLNSDYKYLESDATIQFVMDERKEALTYADTEIDSPYNTYKNPGLTPGPIASPGMAAIKAALYPSETAYFYFVAKGDGSSIFSETYEEHQRNTAAAKRTWGN